MDGANSLTAQIQAVVIILQEEMRECVKFERNIVLNEHILYSIQMEALKCLRVDASDTHKQAQDL